MTYLILANVYLSVFYVFYHVVLQKETFFQLNRVYLLGTTLLAFLLPIVQLGWLTTLFSNGAVYEAKASFVAATVPIQIQESVEQSTFFMRFSTLEWIYLMGCGVQSIWFFIKVSRLYSKLQKPHANDAFSFFSKIHVNEQLKGGAIIRQHEEAHAKQFHSLDVLFMEGLKIINWFNPMVYYAARAIRLNHEFIADERVNEGILAKKIRYSELLMQRTFGMEDRNLTNNFYQSPIKQRITMLLKDRSKRIALLKYAAITPVFVLMMGFSSVKLPPSIDDQQQDHSGFYKALGRNVNITNEAKDAAVSGPLDVSFVKAVDKTVQVEVDSPFDYGMKDEVKKAFRLTEVNSEAPAGKYTVRINVAIEPADEGELNKKSYNQARPKLPDYEALGEVLIVGYKKSTRSDVQQVDRKKAAEENKVNTSQSVPSVKASDTIKSEPVVDEKVDVEPTFPGGINAFYEWIGANYVYTEEAKEAEVNGAIHLSFIVTKAGRLTDIKVDRDLGYGTGEVAVEMLKKSPKWNPGMKGGQPVDAKYSLPIRLNLQKLKKEEKTD